MSTFALRPNYRGDWDVTDQELRQESCQGVDTSWTATPRGWPHQSSWTTTPRGRPHLLVDGNTSRTATPCGGHRFARNSVVCRNPRLKMDCSWLWISLRKVSSIDTTSIFQRKSLGNKKIYHFFACFDDPTTSMDHEFIEKHNFGKHKLVENWPTIQHKKVKISQIRKQMIWSPRISQVTRSTLFHVKSHISSLFMNSEISATTVWFQKNTHLFWACFKNWIFSFLGICLYHLHDTSSKTSKITVFFSWKRCVFF